MPCILKTLKNKEAAELNEMVIEFQKVLKEVAAEEQELKSIIEGGELGLKMSEDLESEYTNLI
ncbi:MAG: hypothetical protein BA871_09805 [Desulfuromonadales bacterium C00003096]|nr:MAG: hypothetical protein BA871_09805 [Desulfuromonadales bacterium C00003096]